MVNDYTDLVFVNITNNGMAFVNESNDILAQVPHMPWYIMSDSNIDFLNKNFTSQRKKILEAMYSNSLLLMILKPLPISRIIIWYSIYLKNVLEMYQIICWSHWDQNGEI